MPIIINSSVGNIVFRLVQTAESTEFPEGSCKVAWDRLMNECAPHTAWLMLKLKSEFHESKLDSAERDPNEWLSSLKGYEFE